MLARGQRQGERHNNQPRSTGRLLRPLRELRRTADRPAPRLPELRCARGTRRLVEPWDDVDRPPAGLAGCGRPGIPEPGVSGWASGVAWTVRDRAAVPTQRPGVAGSRR